MNKRSLFLSLLLLAALVASSCAVYPVGPPVATVPPPPPPAVVIQEPESLFLIPTWGVYFVPGISVDILSYNGLWYYHVRGTWYWSRSYLGPWVYLSLQRVPSVLRRLPPDYRSRYGREPYQVPFTHWRKRWNEPPPPTSYKEPGFLYKLPGAGAYAYPGVSDEIFFMKDRWYSRYKGVWYWSWSYNGPWAYIDVDRVPGKLRDVPRYRYDDKDRDKDKDKERFERVPWGKKKGKEKGKDQDEDDDDYRFPRY
ncbi:MAG: hypothetical protein JSV00_03645 [bacterium]|nr:MAG: hypothetical protein JSV00_03645 [bacterium]